MEKYKAKAKSNALRTYVLGGSKNGVKVYTFVFNHINEDVRSIIVFEQSDYLKESQPIAEFYNLTSEEMKKIILEFDHGQSEVIKKLITECLK